MPKDDDMIEWLSELSIEELAAIADEVQPSRWPSVSQFSWYWGGDDLHTALGLVRQPVGYQRLLYFAGKLLSHECWSDAVGLLGHDDAGVRSEAATTLGKLHGYTLWEVGRKQAVDALLSRWQLEEVEFVRASLVASIAMVARMDQLGIIEKAASDQSSQVRRQAQWALARLIGP